MENPKLRLHSTICWSLKSLETLRWRQSLYIVFQKEYQIVFPVYVEIPYVFGRHSHRFYRLDSNLYIRHHPDAIRPKAGNHDRHSLHSIYPLLLDHIQSDRLHIQNVLLIAGRSFGDIHFHNQLHSWIWSYYGRMWNWVWYNNGNLYRLWSSNLTRNQYPDCPQFQSLQMERLFLLCLDIPSCRHRLVLW